MATPPVRMLAHAKLNLSLRVLAREASGYHQIETLFCAIDLADEVEVSHAANGITLDVKADTPPASRNLQTPDTGPVEENIAVRAATLFAAALLRDVGVHIALVKRIPTGAGLGGGSSDAAAVLRALNVLHGEPFATEELMALGAHLGSDVPFFLADTSLALAWGRGERMLPVPALPSAPVVLAVPHERVSTADAYGALQGAWEPRAQVLSPPRSWRDMGSVAHNEFEDVIFERVPAARALRQTLADAGAVCARMTGSGSVVFGVFGDDDDAHAAIQRIAEDHPDAGTILTRTRA